MQCQLYPQGDPDSFDRHCAAVWHLVKTEVIKIHQNSTGLDLRNVLPLQLYVKVFKPSGPRSKVLL